MVITKNPTVVGGITITMTLKEAEQLFNESWSVRLITSVDTSALVLLRELSEQLRKVIRK